MGCKYSRFSNEGRFFCTVTDDECVYLLPSQKRCIEDGYLEEEDKENDYKAGIKITEVWVDERNNVCVKLKNGDWYHYTKDGTWY